MFNISNVLYLNKNTLHYLCRRCHRNFLRRCLLVSSLILLSIFSSMSQALTSAPKEEVTLQLKWTHQFQFAGYYMAKAKGYYDEAGLDVTINPAQPEKNPVLQVIQDEADFGIGHSELILNYAKGDPVVVLGVVLQRSPMGLVTIDPTINSPSDFHGKKMMLDNNMAEIFAYMRQYSVDRRDVILHRHRLASPVELLRGGVDVLSIYKSTAHAGLQELRQAGHEVKVFYPHEQGIDFYGDNLFTTQRMIMERPNAVRAFREASFKGWHYAINNPEETVRYILENYITPKTYEELLKEAEVLTEFMNASRIYPGNMTEDHWRSIAQTYRDLDYLKSIPDLSNFLYEAKSSANDELHLVSYGILTVLSLVIILLGWFLFTAFKTKNRYANILDKSPLGMLVFDEEHKIVEWSRQAEDIFGWSAKEAMGQSISLLVSDLDRDSITNILVKTLASNGQTPFNLVNNNKTKSGETVTCSWTNTKFTERGKNFVISWAFKVEDEDVGLAGKSQTELSLNDNLVSSASDDIENRQQLVSMMKLALYIWEESPNRTRIDLAELSGVWRVTLDGGTPKTRTLNKYLSIETLPTNPRWRKVLQTVNYVLEQCPEHAGAQELNQLKDQYLKSTGVL